MQIRQVEFTPVAVIELTDHDLVLLTTCAKTHYDGYCRSVAEPGGFLYGMRNMQDMCMSVGLMHRLDSRQLDTLCKITEMRYGFDSKTAHEIYELNHGLSMSLKIMHGETPEPVRL